MKSPEQVVMELEEEVFNLRAANHSLEQAWLSESAVRVQAERSGYILAMRLLQSIVPLDDEEVAARDYFLLPPNARR